MSDFEDNNGLQNKTLPSTLPSNLPSLEELLRVFKTMGFSDAFISTLTVDQLNKAYADVVDNFSSSGGSENDANNDNSIVSLSIEDAILSIIELWGKDNDPEMQSFLDKFVLIEDIEGNVEFVKRLFAFFLSEAKKKSNAQYFQKIKEEWTNGKNGETKLLSSNIFKINAFTPSSYSYTGYWLYFLCYLAYAITENYESVDEFKKKLLGSHYFVDGELYENIFYVLEQSGNDFKAQCEFFIDAIFLK